MLTVFHELGQTIKKVPFKIEFVLNGKGKKLHYMLSFDSMDTYICPRNIWNTIWFDVLDFLESACLAIQKPNRCEEDERKNKNVINKNS